MRVNGINNISNHQSVSFNGKVDRSIYKYLRSAKLGTLMEQFDLDFISLPELKAKNLKDTKRLIPVIQAKLEKYASGFSPDICLGLFYEPNVHFLRFKNTTTGHVYEINTYNGFKKNTKGLRALDDFINNKLSTPEFSAQNIENRMNEYYIEIEKNKVLSKERRKSAFKEWGNALKELLNLKISSK